MQPLALLDSAAVWLSLLGVAWLALALIAGPLLNNPRGEVITGLAYLSTRIYVRLVHRLRIVGIEHVPISRTPGPLVVVANHTSGVDPMLIQSAVTFEIRFMMARDMQPAILEPLWKWMGVIGVDRSAPHGDTRAARDAIRFLQSTGEVGPAGVVNSGVIGIFPEGGIERPPRQLLPFLPGIGLLIHKSGARVLAVVIEGAPNSSSAWGSLFMRSRASLRFLPLIDYKAAGMKPAEIAGDLQNRFLAATGWDLNARPSIRDIRA
ncbi:MAG: 1-acyl-sn-glycerol-3-phosphate acyltransferase [Pyrinomonadaceae bacterium]|nr:1-acyl-sn-glycerol-3-phosphate acyltransferase [Phycisphaerales bacterium]